MNKLEVAMFLIQEAMDEKQRLKQYAKEHLEAMDGSELRCFYEKWNNKIPTKTKVNDNLKMARRLLKESYE